MSHAMPAATPAAVPVAAVAAVGTGPDADRGDEARIGELEAEYEALLAFLYLCPVGVVQCGADGAVRMSNPHAAQLLMAVARSPVIDNLFDALGDSAPELRNLAAGFAARSGHVCEGHRILAGRNGPGPRILSCTLLKTGPDCLVAVLQDVTREVEQERLLRQNEAMISTLVAEVNDFALFSLDADGRIGTWNLSGPRQTGFEADEVLGRELDVLCLPEDVPPGGSAAAEQLRIAAREGWSLREMRCRRRDGGHYWCQLMLASVEDADGNIIGYSVVMRDVTERRMTGDEVRRLLTTDHLTGAANRARFFEIAEAEAARRARGGRPLSAIMFDVDHFKRVNDNFGHAAGDALLRTLVRCGQSCLGENGVLARLGGEEFAVLLPGFDLAAAAGLAERLRAAAQAGLETLDGKTVGATISLGCAEMGPGHDGIDALLRDADAALYRAKRGGRNRVELALPPAADSAVTAA